MEAQLKHLTKAITDATDAAAKEMKKFEQEGIAEVRSRLDSLCDAVLNKVPERAIVQEFGSINTGTWVQNVQIPPTVIDTSNEDLNTCLQQL